MLKQKDKFEHDIVIPKEIWKLPLNVRQKIILAEIHAIDQGGGVALPDSYFEELFNYTTSSRQLSRDMSVLASGGYITKFKTLGKDKKTHRIAKSNLGISKKYLSHLSGQRYIYIYNNYKLIYACPLTNQENNGMVTRELFDYLMTRRGYQSTSIPAEMSLAKKCLLIAPIDKCKRCIDSLLEDEFWRDKPLFMGTIYKRLPHFVTHNKPQPLVVGGKHVEF